MAETGRKVKKMVRQELRFNPYTKSLGSVTVKRRTLIRDTSVTVSRGLSLNNMRVSNSFRILSSSGVNIPVGGMRCYNGQRCTKRGFVDIDIRSNKIKISNVNVVVGIRKISNSVKSTDKSVEQFVDVHRAIVGNKKLKLGSMCPYNCGIFGLNKDVYEFIVFDAPIARLYDTSVALSPDDVSYSDTPRKVSGVNKLGDVLHVVINTVKLGLFPIVNPMTVYITNSNGIDVLATQLMGNLFPIGEKVKFSDNHMEMVNFWPTDALENELDSDGDPKPNVDGTLLEPRHIPEMIFILFIYITRGLLNVRLPHRSLMTLRRNFVENYLQITSYAPPGFRNVLRDLMCMYLDDDIANTTVASYLKKMFAARVMNGWTSSQECYTRLYTDRMSSFEIQAADLPDVSDMSDMSSDDDEDTEIVVEIPVTKLEGNSLPAKKRRHQDSGAEESDGEASDTEVPKRKHKKVDHEAMDEETTENIKSFINKTSVEDTETVVKQVKQEKQEMGEGITVKQEKQETEKEITVKQEMGEGITVKQEKQETEEGITVKQEKHTGEQETEMRITDKEMDETLAAVSSISSIGFDLQNMMYYLQEADLTDLTNSEMNGAYDLGQLTEENLKKNEEDQPMVRSKDDQPMVRSKDDDEASICSSSSNSSSSSSDESDESDE